jgi:hypothetical protein
MTNLHDGGDAIPTSLAYMLNKYAQHFEEMALERHERGAKEYGQFTFLENDTLEMALEELADLMNYVRYTAIKVMWLRDFLASQAPEANLVPEGKDVGERKLI